MKSADEKIRKDRNEQEIKKLLIFCCNSTITPIVVPTILIVVPTLFIVVPTLFIVVPTILIVGKTTVIVAFLI
jgi:hypothetical protein